MPSGARSPDDSAETAGHREESRELDLWTLDQLAPFAQGAGVLLLVNAFYWIVFGDPANPEQLERAGLSALASLLTLILFGRTPGNRPSARFAQARSLVFLLAMSGMCLAGARFKLDQAHPATFALLLASVGALLPGRTWFVAGMAVVYAGFELLVWLHPEAGPWGRPRAAMLGAALAAWAIRSGHLRMARRLARLRAAELRGRRKLDDALALARAELAERQRAEDVLRLREQRLRELAERVPACLWITDAEGNALYANATWHEYAGLGPGDGLGQGWWQSIHHDDLEACRAAHGEACRLGTPYQLELRYRRRDGAYRWFLARALPLRDAEGRVARWFGISTDIDDQKQAAERLRYSRRLFEQMAEASPTILYVHDLDERQNVYVSPSVRSVLGYSREEVAAMGAGVLTQAIVREELADLREPADYQRLADGELIEQELRCRHGNGSIRLLHCREVILARHPDGRARQVLGHAQDVTERRYAEDALRAAGRRREEFLATLAHELRNPLAAIVNASEILATRELEPQHDWARQLIERQSRQLGRLADDLLDVARLGRGLIQMVRVEVDLVRIAKDSIETIRPQAEEAGLNLQVDAGNGPLWISGDAARLEQVIVNLLRNAVKFTEPGGSIRVAARRESAEAVLEVADDGIGIAGDDLPGLFDLFAQASANRQKTGDGLGIGLTLVKSLTELHGGRVHAASDGPGKGSRFTLRFPLGRAPAPTDTPARLAPGPAQRRILLVDDNTGMAQAMAELLQHGGHEARVARDGRSAVEIVPVFRPELILLDVELPDIDGYEVARRIRAIGSSAATPIAVMSGYGRDLDRERSRSAGFVEHLVKPVRYSTLSDLIDRVLARAGGEATGPAEPPGG